tara:strand:- start:15541 stop:16002 length:462 start_codon:yes stop_codon:yes gene_type:complete
MKIIKSAGWVKSTNAESFLARLEEMTIQGQYGPISFKNFLTDRFALYNLETREPLSHEEKMRGGRHYVYPSLVDIENAIREFISSNNMPMPTEQVVSAVAEKASLKYDIHFQEYEDVVNPGEPQHFDVDPLGQDEDLDAAHYRERPNPFRDRG